MELYLEDYANAVTAFPQYLQQIHVVTVYTSSREAQVVKGLKVRGFFLHCFAPPEIL